MTVLSARSDDLLAAMQPRLGLTLAGEVGLSDGRAAAVPIRTRKARALLALLSLHPGGLSRQRAIGLLWPDRAEEQARASLRQAVYEVRGLLGGDALVLADDRLALAPHAIGSDIARADAAATCGEHAVLAELLTRMTPAMLGGLDGLSPELDDWLRSERPTLAARLAQYARHAAEAALHTRDTGLAATLVDQALRIDPLDERSLRVAMRIDAAIGDQARLHRRYRTFADALAREMQAEPAAETQALRATLRAPAGQEETIPVVAPAVVEAVTAPTPASVARSGFTRLHAVTALTIAALLLLTLTGLHLVHGRPAAAQATTIAVVPFTPLSSGSQYLASGIAEEVQEELARARGVQVVGRFTARRVRSGADVLDTARRLGVTHLLDGSVQTDGSRLRVIVGLTRVSDGALLWSDRFDGQARDLFRVQSEIAERVAARFGRPMAAPAAPAAVPLPAVYDRYLAARALMHDRGAVALATADRTLRDAIAAQPDYAPAQALLAQVLMLEADHPASYGALPFVPTRAEARVHAERAAQLDPSLGEAQAALGLLTYSDGESLPFYRRAVALDPQRADFHRWLGQALMAMGQKDAALAQFRRAVAIDPLWGLSYEHLINALFDTGRIAEAAPTVRHFLALSSDDRARSQVMLAFVGVAGPPAARLRLAQHLAVLVPGDRQAAFKYASELASLGEIAAARRVLGQGNGLGQLALAGNGERLAQAVVALGPLFWDTEASFWNIEDTLVTSGHGAVLVQVFGERYGDARHFRPGERIDAQETAALIVALRQSGWLDDAKLLRDRLADQVHADQTETAPAILLAERAVLDAIDGRRDAALASLGRLGRTAPQQLLMTPYCPLRRVAAFQSLATDPRLGEIDLHLQAGIDAARHTLGWGPLRVGA